MKHLLKFLSLFAFFMVSFFVLGVAITIAIVFFNTGSVDLDKYIVMKALYRSLIASSGITLTAIVFSIIDYKKK